MTSDYRARIYSRYAAAHLAAVTRPQSAATMAYDAKVFRRAFGPLLPRDKGAKILDAGAGAGSFLRFLAEEGYAGAEGVEQDEAQVALSRELGVRGLRAGDVRAELASAKGRYDCVVAIDVLEHLRKDELFDFLDSVMGALKPGGVLLWRAPNADGPFSGRLRYGDLTHELSFTRHSAFQLMNVAGFDSVQVLPEPPVITGARSLLRAVLWSLFSVVARLYLFAESYEQGALLTGNLIVSARKPT